LKGDRLDRGRYLPPPGKDAATRRRKSEVKASETAAIGSGTIPLPERPTQQAWSEASVLPIASLGSLDTAGHLASGSLTAMQLPLDNFNLKARTGGGLLTLQNLTGGLYHGRVDASGSLDVRPDLPQLTAQTRIARVPVERLLQSHG